MDVRSDVRNAKRLIAKSSISILAAIILAGCSNMTKKTQEATLRGVSYEFPKSHIKAAVIPPEGRLYVRLEPPGANFHMILDEWNDRPSEQPNVPRISRLTDRFGEFDVISSVNGPIVCDRGPQPHFNCGILVEDGPLKWGVLFDKKYVDQVSDIRLEAISFIRSYRRDNV